LVHRDPEPLKTFDVPILIMHGDDDQILPIDGSARLSAKLIRDPKRLHSRASLHSPSALRVES